MLSFLRAPLPLRTNTANQDILTYDGGESFLRFNGPTQPYAMTHSLPPRGTLAEEPSVLQPPFHYHIHQSETFRVQSGSGHFYVGLNSKPTHTLSAGQRATAQVSAGRYHRFENASTIDTLVVDIQLDPEDYENEQRFFRNFFAYLDDCKKAKTMPSIFQLMVFLHSADTPLALPMPHPSLETNVGIWLSRAFMIMMASIGRRMGYQSSYPEYYLEPKAR